MKLLKKIFYIIIPVTVIVLFLILQIYTEVYYHKLTVPPNQIADIPNNLSKSVFIVNGKKYFLIRNYSAKDNWSFLLSLKSSIPIYIYDYESGELVDWVADGGDNSAFLKKWQLNH